MVQPYKKREFRSFLKTIRHGQQAHWVDIARAIGVDQDTITKWKDLPEAQEAIQEGIDNALNGMELAGKKDWRMYEAKLKMLGVNPALKVEHEAGDTMREILAQYGGGDGKPIDELPSTSP